MKVMGIEKVDYVSKKTGKPVRGLKLHMCYKSEAENVSGYSVVSEFIPEKVQCTVNLNDEIKLLYNKFGQVDEVVFL